MWRCGLFGWDFLLMLSQDSEDEMWSRFMFELQEVTLARWTQPSGPLCLWQCFQILSQNFELCSETNILSQQLSYLCTLSISGLRNAPMLSIWQNWQVIFLSSLSTARTKCRVKQYNSHNTTNFDVPNQN